MDTVRIGLMGDYQPGLRAHVAIPRALHLASNKQLEIDHVWLPTRALRFDHKRLLEECDGVWCTPGGPYESAEGVLLGIRFVREHRYPFLGSCSGFHYAVIEYFRDVIGLEAADHAETNPSTEHPVIAQMPKPLQNRQARVALVPGTRMHSIYGSDETLEDYDCQFGFNLTYRKLFESLDAAVCALGEDSVPHAFELRSHPFFFATLFTPSLKTVSNELHPLFRGFLHACWTRKQVREQGAMPE